MSTWHSKVEPVSVEVNAKVGVVSLVGFGGPLVIVVFGAVMSIVNVCEAGVGSTLPAASMARTSNVCVPAASVAGVKGTCRPRSAAVSMRHWNVEPASVEVNAKVGVVSLVGSGPAVIVVSGAMVSTVHVCARGRRVDVAGGVDGAHLEGVRAPGESPV